MNQEYVNKERSWGPFWLGFLISIIVIGLIVGVIADNEGLSTSQRVSLEANK